MRFLWIFMDFMDYCDSSRSAECEEFFGTSARLGKPGKQVKYVYTYANFHARHLGGFCLGFNAIPETKKSAIFHYFSVLQYGADSRAGEIILDDKMT